jgi:lipoprotein-anchoring transpeptidase ErfK/SrfK
MISRRILMLSSALGLFSMAIPAHALTAKNSSKFKLDPIYEPQKVRFFGYPKGTIVVDPKNHFLYLTLGFGRARRYGVGVGQAGLTFKGKAKILRKAEWPSWTPTANMIKKHPEKYARFAGGVPGGKNNPLGARALYLFKGRRDTYFRIHGTTQPDSIGRSVSNGCIRMINDHVVDLYERVPLGTQVIVL